MASKDWKLEKIKKEHILEAAKNFDRDGGYRGFFNSKSFDVIIRGNHYPPKAICASAHELATSYAPSHKEFSGTIDGPWIKKLKDLGFDVVGKNGVIKTDKKEVAAQKSKPSPRAAQVLMAENMSPERISTQRSVPILVQKARKYLLTFDGVTEDVLDRHLRHWKDGRQDTLSGIYRKFIHHAKNRQGMPNTIGDISRLEGVLFAFDPKKVIKKYKTHIDLLAQIKKEVKIAGKIDPDNNKSHWVIYAKSVLSAAHFLKRFETAQSFHDFVGSFYRDEYTRLALPILLKEEIFGFGFALACDFLKESGYEQFVKPDTHIKEICRAAGITESDTDFVVFKDVISYCDKHGLVPYEFDKLIWLVGSGTLHIDDKQIPINKKEFIASLIC